MSIIDFVLMLFRNKLRVWLFLIGFLKEMFFKDVGISPMEREDFTKLLSANVVAQN